jgi:hypothetical protein
MVHDKSCHNVWGPGSYNQDLWYCILYRNGLARRFGVPLPPTPPVFNSQYTIQHYCALLYFNTWDFSNDWRQDVLNLPMLDGAFTCRKERETAPAYSEWNLSDLLMMEERLRWAGYLGDDHYDAESECSAIDHSSDEWETESEEDGAD